MHSHIYNSRDEFHKRPFGAVPAGTEVSFTLKLPKFYDPKARLLVYSGSDRGSPVAAVSAVLNGWDRDHDFRTFRFTPENAGLYFYCFEAILDNTMCRITKGKDNLSVLDVGELWQLTVYDKEMTSPELFNGGVIYQIFPDRFCRSGTAHPIPQGRILRSDWGGVPKFLPDEDGEYRPNDYFGGDLQGIILKLDYLAQLGVTAIYLNPIFESHSNHRYNTADYKKIDPLLGSEEDFRFLCAEAEKRGIAIILDGVFSHTGSDSIYFNKEGRYGNGGAYRDPSSPYREWYDIKPDGSYDSWWGFRTLPNVKETNPSYMEFICGREGVLQHWLNAGALGWRLDVADELPDEFLDKCHEAVKSNSPQAIIIGEVWEDASNKSSYGKLRRYLLGGQIDSVMNYPFRQAVFSLIRDKNAPACLQIIMSILENYPTPTINCLMNMLSSHDVERAITALGGLPVSGRSRLWQGSNNTLTSQQYQRGKELFMLASVMQFTLPGIPSIYYGDEAGLYGYKDPFNRGCFPWEDRDDELTDFFIRLGRVRKNPAFVCGAFIPLIFESGFAAYKRADNSGNEVLVVINADENPRDFKIPENFSTDPALKCGKLHGSCFEGCSAAILFSRI